MDVATLGIDLGKNSCSLVGLDADGRVVLRRRMRPASIPRFTEKLAPCVIAMEACCGAHYLGRQLIAQGHTTKLMPPEYVRPYVKAQKNDDRDAEAIAEAATRPTMRFVELKSQEQLDIQSLHRVRSRLVGVRTALINQLRAILLERGTTVPQGRRTFERAIDGLLAEAGALPEGRIRQLVVEVRGEWQEIDQRIAALDREFSEMARAEPAARRLSSVPGIEPLTATAMIAAVGKGANFDHARDLAAWIGLVPRQSTTGGKPKLLGISKRGNTYLRTLLIHGARATMHTLSKSKTALGEWLRKLLARAHYNVAVVALANKLARLAWATMRRDIDFAHEQLAAA
ncbi:transposase [Novosphingobium chloroacetimidivorans]|uniref:Transposase n=1 Tax=Novosphingobium chloroacetimidivorans TaxID=1428314 RepID=A0A7W7NYM0_9SPHN|nr:IS110 family transposase [Novosphingobium chloroacetimidivorans]MBB4860614.1 transposase [Novosphingobium chloroacetimidivorans]